MNVIIVGCGRVGQTLAEKLNGDGNDVTVIDTSTVKVNEITSKYDVMGIVGNGATHTVLREAGIASTDLFIAVTNSDELNLLCCMIAKREGDCQTIARLKSPEYSGEVSYLKDELGLAMVINPEYAAAEEIARVLRFPSAIQIEPFAKGKVELIKFRLSKESELIGMSVREMAMKYRADVIVGTIERGDQAYIANGDFVFEEKDTVSFIASSKDALDFFAGIHSKIKPIKDVLIVGGGETTHYLCALLERSGISVKVIEKSGERCTDLAVEFGKATIINGDPADEDTLREEGVAQASAFVALTGLDEENILLSLFAKRTGSRKVITKINRIEYDDIINHLDLDSIVYPKNITADMIVSYVRAVNNTRGSNIETLYKIVKGKAEAAEFTVGEGSPIIGKPLSELSFKPNVLIAAIQRGGAQITPRGQSIIEAGDSVIVVTKGIVLEDVSDILK